MCLLRPGLAHRRARLAAPACRRRDGNADARAVVPLVWSEGGAAPVDEDSSRAGDGGHLHAGHHSGAHLLLQREEEGSGVERESARRRSALVRTEARSKPSSVSLRSCCRLCRSRPGRHVGLGDWQTLRLPLRAVRQAVLGARRSRCRVPEPAGTRPLRRWDARRSSPAGSCRRRRAKQSRLRCRGARFRRHRDARVRPSCLAAVEPPARLNQRRLRFTSSRRSLQMKA